MKKIIYVSIWLIFAQVAWAQQNSFFTHYSSEDGLSQNTVMSMLQDHKGNLWFSTWDGINRFNGYTFKTYKARQGSFISMTNNRADRIYEDRYGYLWLLTYDSRVHRFDPRTEQFEQVPAQQIEGSNFNILAIKVLSNGSVWLLTDKNGAIRVKTDPVAHSVTTDLYSVDSGRFPANQVYQVYLDTSGQEWILTDNGLGMIQAAGNRLLTYFVEKKKGATPPQAFYAAAESPDEILFGSDHGAVQRYSKRDKQFRLLQLPASSHITSIHCVFSNKWVITTEGDGFFTYDSKLDQIQHYAPLVHPQLSDKPILSAYVDRASEVWFEQEEPGVVTHFNPQTGRLTRQQMRVESTSIDRARPAFHIHEDIHGTLWVHPYGGGFSAYNRKENRLEPFYNEIGSRNWKFSNKIHSSFSDSQGNLWLCTHSKGLEKVTFRSVPFTMLTPEPNGYESLSNEVRALSEDGDGNIWVGLKDGMLRIYDRRNNYLGFLTDQGRIAQSGTPMYGNVYSILRDSKGVMWLGTKGAGLVRAERAPTAQPTYRLTRYTHQVDDLYSLSNNNVYCVYEDHYGRIWVATFANGINYLTQDKDGNARFINHRNRLKGYPIDLCYKTRFITSDNNGHLWVGTTAGAVAFDEQFDQPEEIQYHHFARKPNDEKSLSTNDVHWIVATRKKELYFATFGGGLNQLISIDAKGHAIFKSYSVLDGLPSDVLLSIQEDRQENLWISTENGIAKFTPSEEKFDNYDDRIITFDTRFSEGSSMMTTDGRLMFGTSTGLFSFHPDSIRKSRFVPPIVFSKLMLANEEVLPGKGSVLQEGIDDTKELILTHRDNIFSIQYAALDYTNPQNIQYAYKLEGFDAQWTLADKQHSVTYTSLPKGHYTFMVRSTNSDGVWRENTRTLEITVLPSFWETPFAYSLYVLFVLLIISVTVYILFTIYRLKHEVSIEHQVSDIKLRFFTNVSHELRTPLTLIAGPVESVLQNPNLPADAREQLVVVERNISRMLRLVNQILDFRKIQDKKMKMEVEQLEVVSFVRKIMDNFESLAIDHQIDFSLQLTSDAAELYLWLDVDKFEKIIFNLLSNAFKYTPNGKAISIFIQEKDSTVCIGVNDQGIGIAESRRKTLFVRFESLVDRNFFNQESTGIGLSLVKELVEMHQATIVVDSRLGEGSSFQVEFKKGKDHYDESVEFILDDAIVHRIYPTLVPEVSYAIPDSATLSGSEGGELDQPQPPGSKELMLLVEDNQELRSFLRSIFIRHYAIVEASDGEEGYEKAAALQPDIIISDVMMPVKDGIELMKELRANLATSHIPIILLTAKSAVESKIEGLECGADDYITKPFSAAYLKARVENLLKQRQKLQNLYRTQLLNTSAASPATLERVDPALLQQEEKQPLPEVSSIDHKFLEKLMSLMEKHMDNGELMVDDLVREVAVSRSVFFKKLKTLTGLSPIEFIKEIRIKRAAQLIETGEYNMTQIAYMVGINDPRYFSKCFKSKFGMTPTEYKEQLRAKG